MKGIRSRSAGSSGDSSKARSQHLVVFYVVGSGNVGDDRFQVANRRPQRSEIVAGQFQRDVPFGRRPAARHEVRHGRVTGCARDGIAQRVSNLEDAAAIILLGVQRQLYLAVLVAVQNLYVGEPQTRHADHRAQFVVIDERLDRLLDPVQIIQRLLKLGFGRHVDIDIHDAKGIVGKEIDPYTVRRDRDDGQHEHQKGGGEERQRSSKYEAQRSRVPDAQRMRPAPSPTRQISG